jgi:hypothetical protein
MHADDVRRHQVRGALHALECAAERGGQRLAEQRLAQARRALQQHVAPRHDGHGKRVNHRLHADDHRSEALLQLLFEILHG